MSVEKQTQQCCIQPFLQKLGWIGRIGWIGWIGCLLLVGCGPSAAKEPVQRASRPTATPLFALEPTPSPDQSSLVLTPSALPFTPTVTDTTSTVPVATPDQATHQLNFPNAPTAVNAGNATAPVAPTNQTDLPASPTAPLLADESTPAAPITPTATPPATSAELAPDIRQRMFLPMLFHPTSSQDLRTETTELDILAETTEDENIAEIVVYDDALDPNWTAEQSSAVSYDLAATSYTYSSTTAIAITPDKEFGRFFLTVRPETTVAYRSDQVLGISFWLSGGDKLIENDDLAVTVIGSNDYTYWVANDTSIPIEGEITEDLPLFSETRLYFLDVNHSIPAGTWVEIIVWLDELVYDPDYNYITGIYLKNDADFLQTFYIDRVSLLLERR